MNKGSKKEENECRFSEKGLKIFKAMVADEDGVELEPDTILAGWLMGLSGFLACWEEEKDRQEVLDIAYKSFVKNYENGAFMKSSILLRNTK